MKIYTEIVETILFSGPSNFAKIYFVLGDDTYITSQSLDDLSTSAVSINTEYFEEGYHHAKLIEIKIKDVSYTHINTLIWYIMQ